MLTLPNYQISTQIYESANSLVYRGIRKADNQQVILKVLKEDYPTPEELTRYRQEYEITHDLNIIGVIKVYEIEKYQNTLVIILEDFGGDSLRQLMTDCPLTVVEFLPLAIKIANILSQIHASHIIHKDINPNNIVVNSDTKELKIIDFGIASRLPRENPTLKNPEQLEGTLVYLSPEQTGRINRNLDYRTDLYSLGVSFYEMLTGQVPFEATDAMELVHCHIAKTPKPMDKINPDIPLIISDIVMKLMAKNVEDRYQSAFGVKVDLEQCLENLADLNDFSFKLAQNDFSGKLYIPQKLYGRENEINTLLQAFERVSQGTLEMMLVAGYSGVGKTALVREVHKPMTSKRGYFAAGKFDQFQKNIPYSAITQAFNEFCHYLLMENAETLSYWQTNILKAVGNNGHVIIDVIPDLELVIGPQPAVAQVGPIEAQNRFNLFFMKFVKALCNKYHPFILFIDDLQWVDSASLALLKAIMLDDEIKHLLIIGAYRDNEVDSSHPFMMALAELEEANITINSISLGNLREGHINQLLQESLLCEVRQTQSLTDLIYQKTQGNAFFTHQFLQTLFEKGLLRFDFQQLQWQWNIEQIAAQNLTANVVELMANKIRKLPAKTSKVLQLAACIGNQFDLSILAIIYEQTQNNTLSILWNALVEELIQPLDENYKCLEVGEKTTFKFLHDRVQQAAIALIDDEQKKVVHLQIGRLLLKNTSAETLEEKLFDVVGQFNYSIEQLTLQAERVQIAQLNLLAGQKAKMANAYSAAVNYFAKGRECLDEISWESESELTLELFTEATEAAYLNGDFEQMEQLVQIILQQTPTLASEMKICEVQILAHISRDQHQDAINVALAFLERLDIPFSPKPLQKEVEVALQKMQDYLSDKPIQSFIDFPTMTNNQAISAMQIMAAVIPSAYNLSPNLMILIIIKQVELSIQYGNISESNYSYSLYGLILSAIVLDIESGYQFGQLSLDLLKRSGDKKIKAKVIHIVNLFIVPWKKHLRETLQPNLESYHAALEIGDLVFAGYSIFTYMNYSYFSGKKLALLEQEIEQHHNGMIKLKQEGTINWYRLFWQIILNLRGTCEHPGQLIGQAYDETVLLSVHQQANDQTGLYHLYLNKAVLHYLFHQYEQAIKNIEKAKQYLQGITGNFVVSIYYFYDSLIRLALYSSFYQPEQQAVLTQVSTNQQKLKFWATPAPMNFQHKYDLVEAEKARVLGQIVEAETHYELAIKGAANNDYIQEEALAYELAAQFYLGRLMDKFFQTYLKEAHYRYQQWGALAKVADLEAHYPQLLTTGKMFNSNVTAMTTLTSSSFTGFKTSTILDLDSVTKASQVIAGEIILSKLLEKMMHIVIENAGAERGVLLLPQHEQWVIEAEGAIDKAEVTVLHSLPIFDHLPAAIISYVARTQENVVLMDATREGLYTENSYIKTHQTQSVLCFPIVYQQQLRAILYFENNLTTGAFTPQRLNVLQMLSSQIAISLENAQYASLLEDKVKQRTIQLATANQEITLLNERLKKENLRMSAELDVAKQLQQMVLPKESELQQIENLDIAGFMEPADEVGGDYYDVLVENGKIKIGIGDVTGHGLESGVLMLMVQTTVQALLLAGIDNPEKFLNVINRTIYKNVQRMETDKNLTLSLLDYFDGQLQITGQHEEVLLVRQNGQIERIDTFDLGYSVGVVIDIADWVAHTKISLQPGDGIVLYTDGITEARNTQEELYRLDRLCEIVSTNWQQTAQEIQQAVITDVRQFIGEQKVFDDITLLILKQK